MSLAAIAALLALAPPRIEVIDKAAGLPTDYPFALARTPDGAVWTTLRAEQGPLAIEGLARVEGGHVTSIRGVATGLRSDDVRALAVDATGTLWAATAKGLHRRRPDGRFEAVGGPLSLSYVAVTADAVWVAGGEGRSVALARVGRDGLEPLRVKGRCFRPIRLLALSRDAAVLLCQDGLVLGRGNAAAPMALEKTPLFDPRSRSHDSERRTPPIWIYDGALGVGEDVWLISATKRLVRLREGKFEAVAEGHFARFAEGRAASGPVLSDFDGHAFGLEGGALKALFTVEKGDIGAMRADPGGSLFLVAEPEGKPHALVGLAPGLPEARWDLGGGGLLSPGVLGMTGDGAGGVWIATNRGLWHLLR